MQDEKTVITRRLCLLKDVGLNGNLFGGNMMAWLDEAASIFSFVKCQTQLMVTGSIERVNFVRAVKPGNMVVIYGRVLQFTTASIKIGLEAWVHDVETNHAYEVCHTQAVFVQIGHDGKPKPIHSVYKDAWEAENKKG